MDEQALYRAVLAAPHDDTPRLVLADYLDEFAAGLPEPAARLGRGRAELIRVGCALARAGHPWHYGPLRNPALDPGLVRRAKRLRFLYSGKLRRGLPGPLAGHPFDRGFLRPRLSLRPYEFLGDAATAAAVGVTAPPFRPVPPLPAGHPMRRYVPGDDPFDAFPLWDVHLFAWSDQGRFPEAADDRGQYGELLRRCAESLALARVGWLKVSFFRTPTLEFFRVGDFANVEALELNCGPFPEVLEAVAGNPSFRSLRYVSFGTDHWAWCPTPELNWRRAEIGRRLSELNARHLPYGAMRMELGALLRDLPAAEPAPVPQPVVLPPLPAAPARANELPARESADWSWVFLVLVLAGTVMRAATQSDPPQPNRNPPAVGYTSDQFKLPPVLFDPDALKSLTPVAPPGGARSVAPPPREVKRE